MESKNFNISGAHIRLIRHLKGFKQTEAAKKLGITQQAYSKLECCKKLTETKALKVISALNFTIEELDKVKSIVPI